MAKKKQAWFIAPTLLETLKRRGSTFEEWIYQERLRTWSAVVDRCAEMGVEVPSKEEYGRLVEWRPGGGLAPEEPVPAHSEISDIDTKMHDVAMSNFPGKRKKKKVDDDT